MPKSFRFYISRTVVIEQSGYVTIEADTIEAAQAEIVSQIEGGVLEPEETQFGEILEYRDGWSVEREGVEQ